jgi:hypothetical protein
MSAISLDFDKVFIDNKMMTSIDGELCMAIKDYDQMPPFFMSVVSASDVWLFVSSYGSLSAGRDCPEKAIFPYVTDDKIHDGFFHTGSVAVFQVGSVSQRRVWEPFNQEQNFRYNLERTIYKNLLGTKLYFEEVNHDLHLTYRYCLSASNEFGLVKSCSLISSSQTSISVTICSGFQNLLPAEVPRSLQQVSSNLVDAYKLNEIDCSSALGVYSLYSGITDKPEPFEALRATSVFSLGLESAIFLSSTDQLSTFKRGFAIKPQLISRGVRGAYLAVADVDVLPGGQTEWAVIADTDLSQSGSASLRKALRDNTLTLSMLKEDLSQESGAFEKVMAKSDGIQKVSNEIVSAHHFANVVFNVMRGGIYADDYFITLTDFVGVVKASNQVVYERFSDTLSGLPARLHLSNFIFEIDRLGDADLSRLAHDYLPLTFGRRHGDPSRPWNHFSIRLEDDNGDPKIYYQGNWRDIFQNLEALSHSYPDFIENIIAKFVNASTADGYNPYRITKDGIDWEIEDPDDPWSYIGYWGDHQIIYLTKLLEVSRQYHPGKLEMLLKNNIFSYANVPYRIASFSQLLDDPKNTVSFDQLTADQIDELVDSLGNDGKLVQQNGGGTYHVNLTEKLLVPLLAKLSNFVLGGGIWLNTQRPEWNDANNALVGQGLSMVTVYYLRRYIRLLQEIFTNNIGNAFELSARVSQWLLATQNILQEHAPRLKSRGEDDSFRLELLSALGIVGSDYRSEIYANGFDGKKVDVTKLDVRNLLDSALLYVEQTIKSNLGSDGLYEAYNRYEVDKDQLSVRTLYPMLEGQVAALSSGAMGAKEAVQLLSTLYKSEMYRFDQDSFTLYPDKAVLGFIDKNTLSPTQFDNVSLLNKLTRGERENIFEIDADNNLRFSPSLTSLHTLKEHLEMYDLSAEDRSLVVDLYEGTFNHDSFTGRSGGMFGFEGLGCIYWHMVSKLLLAVQEVFYRGLKSGDDASYISRLGALYYRVQAGLGYKRDVSSYGAFITDPYSHTPKHSGARQPGMTGQVKEEILTRLGELGVLVVDGKIELNPVLLQLNEFISSETSFRYLSLNGDWLEEPMCEQSLGFTFCQVPFIYHLKNDQSNFCINVHFMDGTEEMIVDNVMPDSISQSIFSRSNKVAKVVANFSQSVLFVG